MKHACKELVAGGQLIGKSECPYHAGGGSTSLACGDVLDHSEDAPIWYSLKSGTRVRAVLPGTATAVDATVVRCDGNCDRMTYTIRPLRSRKEIQVTGWSITFSHGERWRS